MKTNQKWYRYDDEGHYFKLDKGVLMGVPMLSSGARAKEEGYEIDWDRIDKEDKEFLMGIATELEEKD